MKSTIKALGIIAFVAVIGFTFIACDSGNGDKDEDKDAASLITGKFASQNGTGDAVFYADYVSASRSASRAVAGMSATEKELVGKIEDGDIIFNLSGVYDASNDKFTLSAGSSFLIYNISGTLTNGNMTSTEAEIRVKSGNEWSVHTVAVTGTTSDVTITGNASNEQVNGIPARWFGLWKITDPSYAGIVYKITSFDISLPDEPDMSFAFIDVTSLGNTKIEGVTITESRSESYDGSGNIVETTTTYGFIKFWIEETGAGLTLTMFNDSDSDDFATAKAFDTEKALIDEEALKTQYPNYPYEDDSDDPNTISRIFVIDFVRP